MKRTARWYFVLCCVAVIFAGIVVGTKVTCNVAYAAEEQSYILTVKDGQDITTSLTDALKQYRDITIPEGMYSCDSIQISNLSNLTIRATGATISLKQSAANPLLYTASDSKAENIEIVGGCWKANGMAVPAIRIYGKTCNIKLQDMEVSGSGDVGIRIKGASGDIQFSNVAVSSNQKSGVRISECPDLQNVLIENGNYVQNQEYGLQVTDTPAEVVIKRVYASNNRKSGIFANNCTGSVYLFRTKTKSNNENGISISNSRDVTVNTVTSAKNGSFGIRAENIKLEHNDTYGLLIKGSEITSNKSNGVYVINCDTVRLKTSNMQLNNGCGVYARDTERMALYSNTVKQNTNYGMNFETCSHITCNAVTVESNNNIGLRAVSCPYLKITSGSYNVNGSHGIYVSDSLAKLYDVNASENYWGGFVVTGSAAKAYVYGGKFNGNGTRPDNREDDDTTAAGASAYDGALLSISEAECNQNHGSGINAAGDNSGKTISRIAVYGCNCLDNGDHGITAHPYSKINIKSSSNGIRTTVKGNKYTAVLFNDHSSSDYITDCDVYDNQDMGISIGDNSKIKNIQNCMIYNNKKDGIHIMTSSSAFVKNCNIYSNSGYGIYCGKKGSMTVNDCSVTKNKLDGIRVTGVKANVAVTKCLVNSNLANGIAVASQGTLSKLDNSEICNNEKHGIAVYEAGVTGSVSGNKCTGNSGYQIYVSNGADTDLKKTK